ncbi:MAG: hypothetical protein K940chlam5_00501 [Candidatus Anoxychlamydiales bacterium]|nr:hypothetical protein [Candidatus Anoxychlamydiales bacterium]
MKKDSPKNDILKSVGKKILKNMSLALLNKIPIIGDITSATVSSFIEANDEKKINELLSIIDKKLHNLDESKIDKTYLKSDEFKNFIIKILKTTREISLTDRDLSFSGKVHFFASLATENMLITRLKKHTIWKEEFINIISSLNDDELKCLKIMYDYSKKPLLLSRNSTLFNPLESTKLCIDSLISKRLLNDSSIQNIKDKNLPGANKLIKKEGLIMMTNFACEVIEFMNSIQINLNKNFSGTVNHQ